MARPAKSFPPRHSQSNSFPRFLPPLPKFPDATNSFFRLSLFQRRELRCLPLLAVQLFPREHGGERNGIRYLG